MASHSQSSVLSRQAGRQAARRFDGLLIFRSRHHYLIRSVGRGIATAANRRIEAREARLVIGPSLIKLHAADAADAAAAVSLTLHLSLARRCDEDDRPSGVSYLGRASRVRRDTFSLQSTAAAAATRPPAGPVSVSEWCR